MSGVVRRLPDAVVNQIAAGEVVERPASVLKELLENAVDASARRIEARVEGPFPFTITVADDGCGMSAADLDLAVMRHTTSKIASAEDLNRIATYGFRGEALPSIGAVCRLRITSRRRADPVGWEIVVEDGKVCAAGEAGARAGTTVTVSDIFANVPARRKFLKSQRTESAHLWDVFHAVAIPREGIHFGMSDGRTEWTYEEGETAAERAMRHAGEDGKYLVALRGSSPFFRLLGWAGLPQLSRASGTGVHFFLNGRFFRDRGLLFAVREAYRGILPEGRLPVVYLFISCDPSEADVNVHPAKTEVRFRYGRELFELVRHTIGQALGEGKGDGARGRSYTVVPFPARGVSTQGGPAAVEERKSAKPLCGVPLFEPLARGGAEGPIPGGRFSDLSPVGRVLGTYIVCEGGGEMVIVDQHAAGERIVFSRLKDLYLGGSAPLQHWLVPEAVELPPVDAADRGAIIAFLRRAGFAFEEKGKDTLLIKGGPAILGAFDVKRWWRDFLDFFDRQESTPGGIFDADRELWRMACHAAIRAKDPLTLQGMRQLLCELDRACLAHSCPHGRPVWVKISGREMAAMFRRE